MKSIAQKKAAKYKIPQGGVNHTINASAADEFDTPQPLGSKIQTLNLKPLPKGQQSSIAQTNENIKGYLQHVVD